MLNFRALLFMTAFSLTMSLVPFAGAVEPDAAAALVTELKNGAMILYGPEISEQARHLELCDLMQKHVNTQYIGNFATGRIIRQMSPEVRAGLYSGVKSKLVRFFDGAFSRLKDGTVKVNPVSKPAGPARIVYVEVTKLNQSPTSIQFYMAPDSNNSLLMQDAQMSGFSLGQIFKDEFTNVLSAVTSDDPDAKGQALIANLATKSPGCP